MATASSTQPRAFPWVAVLTVGGLLLRLYHYLRNPDVWHDEAALIANVLGKTYREVFGPLSHHDPAPPVFLVAEKLSVDLFGDGTLALRLPPFLASCAALVLLAWLAVRLLPAAAAPWAVLLMAVSDRLLWHACEAKAYSFDVLVAVSLAVLYHASRDWALERRLLAFAALVPLAIFIAFPACFLYGGVLVAFLPDVWRARTARNLLCFGVLTAAVFGFFLLLALGPIRAQRCAEMDCCWTHTFPTWERPWTIPWWSLKSTVEVVDYCFRPLGGALIVLAVAGGYLLVRQGHGLLVLLMTLPIGLAGLAALIYAYPYTGARTMAYALPALALLVAMATPPTLAHLRRRALPLAAIVAVFLLAPAALTLFRVVIPWGRVDWTGATTFVRANLQPTDGVTGNSWEMDYYFRDMGSAYRPMNEPLPAGKRLWVFVVHPIEEKRLPVIASLLSANWEIEQQAKFQNTTVYCLGRRQ